MSASVASSPSGGHARAANANTNAAAVGASQSSSPPSSASPPYTQPAYVPTAQSAGLLAEPTDKVYLTNLICHVRLQLEFFVATDEDEASRLSKGGAKRPIVPGRVGIRCLHCRHLPVQQRAKNYSTFPASVRLINQAVRNYQRFHLPLCQAIPADVRDEYDRLRQQGRVIPRNTPTVGGRKMSHMEYWDECCKARGLVDIEEGEKVGIRFGGGNGADQPFGALF